MVEGRGMDSKHSSGSSSKTCRWTDGTVPDMTCKLRKPQSHSPEPSAHCKTASGCLDPLAPLGPVTPVPGQLTPAAGGPPCFPYVFCGEFLGALHCWALHRLYDAAQSSADSEVHFRDLEFCDVQAPFVWPRTADSMQVRVY